MESIKNHSKNDVADSSSLLEHKIIDSTSLVERICSDSSISCNEISTLNGGKNFNCTETTNGNVNLHCKIQNSSSDSAESSLDENQALIAKDGAAILKFDEFSDGLKSAPLGSEPSLCVKNIVTSIVSAESSLDENQTLLLTKGDAAIEECDKFSGAVENVIRSVNNQSPTLEGFQILAEEKKISNNDDKNDDRTLNTPLSNNLEINNLELAKTNESKIASLDSCDNVEEITDKISSKTSEPSEVSQEFLQYPQNNVCVNDSGFSDGSSETKVFKCLTSDMSDLENRNSLMYKKVICGERPFENISKNIEFVKKPVSTIYMEEATSNVCMPLRCDNTMPVDCNALRENSSVETIPTGYENLCTDKESIVDISVANSERLSDEETLTSEACYMQRVVEGSLQPLDIKNLENKLPIKDVTLFAGVSQDLKLIDSNIENENIKCLIVNSVTESANLTDGYSDENVNLIDLTEPPPVRLETNIESQDDIELPNSKRIKLDIEDDKLNSPVFEGKPSLLKVIPIKNGHGIWDMEELRLTIAERGSVLLRLCAAPEAGDEDIIDGPQADFTALLMEDNYDMPELKVKLSPREDEEDITYLYDKEPIGSLQDPLLALSNHTSTPRLPPHFMSDRNFMERLQIPKSPQPFDDISLYWKAPLKKKSPKRKCLPPPFSSISMSKSPRGGRKRGRPPLHNRGCVPKYSPKKMTIMDDHIKFRPPTPPTSHFSEGSKLNSLLSGSLKKPLTTMELDPRVICSSLSNLKKPARGSIFSKQLIARKESERQERNDNIDDEDDDNDNMDNRSVSGLSDDPEDTCSETKTTKFIKLTCQHCKMLFRKKSALMTHIRLKHKLLKKCPICNESVRVKGKYGMKFHILKAHKDEKSFKCEACSESFKLLHHLKNHKRLAHKLAESSEESVETGSEGGMDTIPQDKSNDGNSKKEGKAESDNLKSATEKTSEVKEGIKNDKTNNKNEKPVKKNSSVINIKEKMKNVSDPPQINLDDSDSKGSESLEQRSSGKKKGLRSQSAITSKASEVLSSSKNDSSSSSESGNESDDEDDSSSDTSDSEVEENKKYFCNQCEMGFSHLFKLTHHKKKRHSKSKFKAADTSETEDKKNALVCKLCRKKCRNKYQLRMHALQHNLSRKQKGLKKPRVLLECIDQRLLSNDRPKKLDSFERNASSSCRASTRQFEKLSRSAPGKLSKADSDDCDGVVDKRKGNDRPSYIIRKGRVFHCTKCNENFKKEKSMTYHLKKIHETLYPFRACPHCSRIFRSCGPYMRHLSQHNGRKCPIPGCKAKYKVLRLIKKHQRHAHPEKPFRCTRCVDLFTVEEELVKHTDMVHNRKNRRNRLEDDDDDDEDDEDEDDDEEEEEMDGEDEEEGDGQGEKDEDVNPKEEEESKSKQKSEKANTKTEERKIETPVAGRRSRTAPISYKEDEEEDFVYKKNIIETTNKKPKLSFGFVPSPSPPTLSESHEESLLESPVVEKKPLSITPQTSPLQNLREAFAQNEAATKTNKKQFVSPLSAPLSSIKPKRAYVRKAPYKKKSDTSWTAALKAQYDGFSNKKAKPPKSPKKLTKIVPKISPNNSSSSSLPVYSPTITADVVRRVAESLLSRHQEQQQKQQQKLQKKQLKQQMRNKTPAFISYSATPSQLPRVAYTSHMNSRDNSLSSFDDSCHTDHLSDYCVGSTSAINNTKKVPDDDDGCPAKVIRFDSF